jgi:acetyltransferase-like isoleucine patch superfamily enzyme
MTTLAYDWYHGVVPSNVVLERDVYVDTAYSFAPFFSEEARALVMGEASGAYDRTAFVVGARGRITVGEYTVLNATTLVCNERITIGAHCLLAWGSVVTDTWPDQGAPLEARRRALHAAAADPHRRLPPVSPPRPVTLEDNVWIGFDAVILPGVTIGRGAIVGCKTIVRENIPPYAVVVGDPARVIRTLDPDDTEEARLRALRDHVR